MPNPFEGLRPALELMARESQQVLPASGQIVEDLERPDLEETYDRLQTREEDRLLETLIETPSQDVVRPVPPKYRPGHHPFRYFLDGSAKTYFIGTVIEQDRAVPVHVAQVGVAAIYRGDDGTIRTAAVRHQILLLVPKGQLSYGEQLEGLVGRMDPNRYVFVDAEARDALADQAGGKEPRSRAPHRANGYMRNLEIQVARELERPQSHWLVVDGNPGSEMQEWRRGELLAVAKQFSRDQFFSIHANRGSRRKISLYQLLADLPVAHRTAAFSVQGGKVVRWYVRLRGERGQLEYPLMGVVKVELPNPGGEPVPTEQIDALSQAVVAERSETPHGRDPRWHAHLYAIYLAEQAIKNRFLSSEILKAGLRWPSLQLVTKEV